MFQHAKCVLLLLGKYRLFLTQARVQNFFLWPWDFFDQLSILSSFQNILKIKIEQKLLYWHLDISVNSHLLVYVFLKKECFKSRKWENMDAKKLLCLKQKFLVAAFFFHLSFFFHFSLKINGYGANSVILYFTLALSN